MLQILKPSHQQNIAKSVEQNPQPHQRPALPAALPRPGAKQQRPNNPRKHPALPALPQDPQDPRSAALRAQKPERKAKLFGILRKHGNPDEDLDSRPKKLSAQDKQSSFRP